MIYSKLYYTILNKPFFIDVRRVDVRAAFIAGLLEHSAGVVAAADEKEPILLKSSSPDGRQVTGDFDKAPEGSVAIIPLKGDMMKDDTWCSWGTESIARIMKEAADSKKVSGIRLDIDSGGGTVDAIAPMVDAIEYCHSKGKAVVASCDLCASAAYYVACHCDKVVADNAISAEFGSIGVMTQFADYAKYYEEKGIKVHTVYADLSGYKNAPFEAARKGDYKSLKEEVLNPLAKQFQEAVKSHRPNLKLDTEGILQGRMFWAQQAVTVGLIDEVGTADSAAADARRLSADMKLGAYVKNLL